MKKVVDHFQKAGVNAMAKVISGKASEVLKDFAIKNGVDLVIIASHGRSGISRLVWGSVAESLLRSLCIPVLMARAPGCGLDK